MPSSFPFPPSIDVAPPCSRVRVSCYHRLKHIDNSFLSVRIVFYLSDLFSSMELCFLNEIGDTVYKVFHIEDGEAFELAVNTVASENVKMDPPKCLNKCATILFSGGAKLLHSSSPQEDEMPNEENTSDLYTTSYSLPRVSKPCSAMKGIREKRGASIGKWTVSWAPDVYDPPPTSVSHFLSRGSKQRMAKKDKKNGKKGHKGKDSGESMGLQEEEAVLPNLRKQRQQAL